MKAIPVVVDGLISVAVAVVTSFVLEPQVAFSVGLLCMLVLEVLRLRAAVEENRGLLESLLAVVHAPDDAVAELGRLYRVKDGVVAKAGVVEVPKQHVLEFLRHGIGRTKTT